MSKSWNSNDDTAQLGFDFTSIVKEKSCGEYSLHIDAFYFLYY